MICLCCLLKTLIRSFIVRLTIRMIETSKHVICTLYFSKVGVFGDAENLVVIRHLESPFKRTCSVQIGLFLIPKESEIVKFFWPFFRFLFLKIALYQQASLLKLLEYS